MSSHGAPENSEGTVSCDITSFLSCLSLLQKLDAGNQLALIEDLHKDIRVVGNEAKGEHVPGFCIPKKVKHQNEHVVQKWTRSQPSYLIFGGS